MKKYITLMPEASNLIESQRSIGYTFSTAIADVLDNSIDAMANTIKIFFDNGGDEVSRAFVAIVDNGLGMDKEELLLAMKYGSKSISEERNKTDLGRFGLGLKMASFSQCKKLTVFSKKDKKINAFRWDLNHVISTSEWEVEELSQDEIQGFKYIQQLSDSGTIVFWEDFDTFHEEKTHFKDVFDERLDDAEFHLSLVFHRYLEDGLSIEFNGRKITPTDPFFTNNKATQPQESEEIRYGGYGIIKVKSYIMPPKNRLSQEEKHLLGKYKTSPLHEGLYVYRNKRLIVWGKWFRVIQQNELHNLARVRIDIPNTMDKVWGIDVKKSKVSIPISMRQEIKRVMNGSVVGSKRVYEYKGNRTRKSKKIQVFDRIEKEGEVHYVLNEKNPILETLYEKLEDEDARLLQQFVQQIERNIPFDSIRYDMAAVDREVIVSERQEEEIYEEIDKILSSQSDRYGKRELFKKLKELDQYAKYPTILEQIEGELNG